MKKILTIILSMALLLSAVSVIVYADNPYTIRQYIRDYYHDTYNEDSVTFNKISMIDTKASDEVLQLPDDFLQNELFDNQIEKINKPYAIQTSERYYITFQSINNNLLYLCITQKGELFFGRYADYTKPNYCEYTIKDTDKVLKKLSELCQATSYLTAPTEKLSFTDIDGHWAENAINKWADKGIIAGYSNGTFKPDSPVTRAELAKILTLAFDLQPSEFVYSDRDLSEDAWYYNYLLCAGKYIPNYALPEINEKNQPYVDNSTFNAFLPEQNAMRMHVAEALVEIKKEKDKLNVDLPDIVVIKDELNKTFKDADYENLYANHGAIPENVRRMFEYTYLANKLDIMRGDTDGYFRPYDSVTRAEIITMIDRVISNTN